MWSSGICVALFVLDVFIALTAVGGGIALLTGMEKNRYKLDMLEKTPFSSYTIPGLLLSVVVGGSALAAAIVLPFSQYDGSIVSIVAGVIMMGWITGEILILKQPFSRGTWVEIGYFACGLAMWVLGAIAL